MHISIGSKRMLEISPPFSPNRPVYAFHWMEGTHILQWTRMYFCVLQDLYLYFISYVLFYYYNNKIQHVSNIYACFCARRDSAYAHEINYKFPKYFEWSPMVWSIILLRINRFDLYILSKCVFLVESSIRVCALCWWLHITPSIKRTPNIEENNSIKSSSLLSFSTSSFNFKCIALYCDI